MTNDASSRVSSAARVDGAAGPSSSTSRAAHTPAVSVGFTLSSLGYAVSRRFQATLAPLGLEPREFALLRTIASRQGASQQAIGEQLQIPPSRMVAFVDALEERRLIERRANPEDRRARALHLTDEGRKLLAEAFRLAGELEAELCSGLSQAELLSLLAMLRRVGAQLGVGPGIHAAHSD